MGEADKPSFAVVGAGASGIIAAYQVQTRFPGASISVFEKNDSLGGTWYSNSYPGAACDVKSHLYQFSFDLNPNWSEAYSPQQEIENYFLDVVKRHEIQQHIQLNVCAFAS
jgi:cation diffusion facilitator CzcD-associated flavoprotein CzcO